jgi:hypothetical protein
LLLVVVVGIWPQLVASVLLVLLHGVLLLMLLHVRVLLGGRMLLFFYGGVRVGNG